MPIRRPTGSNVSIRLEDPAQIDAVAHEPAVDDMLAIAEHGWQFPLEGDGRDLVGCLEEQIGHHDHGNIDLLRDQAIQRIGIVDVALRILTASQVTGATITSGFSRFTTSSSSATGSGNKLVFTTRS